MTLLILAAGLGSRYGGVKQIEPIGKHNEILSDYSIYDAMLAGFDKVVFIIRSDIEKDFCERLFNHIAMHIKAEYVFQDINDLPKGFSVPDGRVKPWGTVHAILSAKRVLNEPFCVVNADDFYGGEAYYKMAEFFKTLKKDDRHKYALVSYKLASTLSDQGTVSRGICEIDNDGMITNINERLKIGRRGDKIGYSLDGEDFHEIDADADASMNFSGFTPDIIPLFEERFVDFLKKNGNDTKAELQFAIALNDLLKDKKISIKKLSSNDKWLGFTYPEDKPVVRAELEKLATCGIYPTPLWR